MIQSIFHTNFSRLKNVTARRTALIVGIFLLAFTFWTCQKAVEPSDILRASEFTVQVIDQSGNPIPSAKVLIAEGANIATSLLSGAGVTDQSGAIKITYNVEPAGKILSVQVIPPSGSAGLQSATPFYNGSVIVPCSGSTLLITFNRETPISCNSLTQVNENVVMNLCYDTASVCRAYTPDYKNTCTTTITITATNFVPALPNGVAPHYYKAGVEVSPAFTVAPNESFKIGFIINSPSKTTINYTGNMTFTGTSNGGANTNVAGSVSLSATAKLCDDCSCPPADILLANKTPDTVCIGTSKQIDVPLTFTNTSKKGCDYIFTLEQDFTDPDLSLISFNGGSKSGGTLLAGSALTTMSVKFTPTKNQIYAATAVYKIQKRNSLGQISDCPTKLRITFNGYGGQAQCQIVLDPKDTTLLTTTQKIYQCVGMDESENIKKLRIRNPSGCPVTLNSNSLSAPFKSSPTTLTLQPGETQDIEVHFVPQTNDVWPTGRGGAQVKFFPAILTVSGCTTTSINISGIPNIDCGRLNSGCLYEWGFNNIYQSFTFGRETTSTLTITISTDKNIAFRDLYISNINIGANTITLGSMGSNGLAYTRFYLSTQFNGTSDAQCVFAGPYVKDCDKVPGGAGTIVAGKHDIVLFKILYTDGREYCGLLWIEDILLINGQPRACVHVCYPL